MAVRGWRTECGCLGTLPVVSFTDAGAGKVDCGGRKDYRSSATEAGKTPLSTWVGKLDLGDHESHSRIPVVVVPVAGYGSQFLKETGSSSPGGPEQLIAAITKIQQCV